MYYRHCLRNGLSAISALMVRVLRGGCISTPCKCTAFGVHIVRISILAYFHVSALMFASSHTCAFVHMHMHLALSRTTHRSPAADVAVTVSCDVHICTAATLAQSELRFQSWRRLASATCLNRTKGRRKRIAHLRLSLSLSVL